MSWKDLKEKVKRVLHLDEEPWRIAAGMAVGVFISFTPFYGFHTAMALVSALLLRVNAAATLTGSLVVIPPAIPLVWGFCYQVGKVVLERRIEPFYRGGPSGERIMAKLAPLFNWWEWDWARIKVVVVKTKPLLKPLLVGTTVVGALAAVAAYFLTLFMVNKVRLIKARARLARERSAPEPFSS